MAMLVPEGFVAGPVDGADAGALAGWVDGASVLNQIEAEWDRRAALGVVLAAHNYPDEPRKGDRIEGLPRPSEDCRVFHAGTRLEGKQPVTSGGRVLCVTALGDSVRIARSRAYDVIEGIRFDGMQYRKDIGHRALKPAKGK